MIESNPFLAGSPVPCLSDDLYARCGWLEHQSDGGPHWKRTHLGPPPGLLNAACDILHLCSNSHRSKRGPSWCRSCIRALVTSGIDCQRSCRRVSECVGVALASSQRGRCNTESRDVTSTTWDVDCTKVCLDSLPNVSLAEMVRAIADTSSTRIVAGASVTRRAHQYPCACTALEPPAHAHE